MAYVARYLVPRLCVYPAWREPLRQSTAAFQYYYRAATGIWHGANWTFLLWGLYYAVFLMVEKLFLLKALDKCRILGHIYTIVIVMFGWVMFQLNSLSAIGSYTSAMLGFGALLALRNPQIFIILAATPSPLL